MDLLVMPTTSGEGRRYARSEQFEPPSDSDETESRTTRHRSDQAVITDTGTSKTFLGLSGEVRNRIYELVLLRPEAIETHGRLHPLPIGLLRVNKGIQGEASSVFYGENSFDLSRATPDQVIAFLDQIGSHNAGLIQSIIIKFPDWEYTLHSGFHVKARSASALSKIRSSCVNLKMIETSLDSEDFRGRLNEYQTVAAEALDLTVYSFGDISSKEIIVEVLFEDGGSDCKRTSVGNHGCTIVTTVYYGEEPLDDGFDGQDYGDYDEYGDDVDVLGHRMDNDSDFYDRVEELIYGGGG